MSYDGGAGDWDGSGSIRLNYGWLSGRLGSVWLDQIVFCHGQPDYVSGSFDFLYISLSLRLSMSPKFGLRPKISQKVKLFFRLVSAIH